MMKIKELKVVEKFKYVVAIALAVIIAGLVILFIPNLGMKVGIDFAGGAIVKVDLGDYAALHSYEKEQAKANILEEVKENGFTVSLDRWSGDDSTVLEISLALELNGNKISQNNTQAMEDFNNKIQGTEANSFKDGLQAKIESKLDSANLGFEFEDSWFEYDIVGASASNLLKNAIWATAVAIVVMLIYIMFRFTVSSGLAAVICLTHDVLVMVAFTTFFRIQVNTTFVVAIVTIVGYSINATIVLFDRIREIRKLNSMKDKSDAEVANKAVVDTLGRTLLTTVTTLSAIAILAIVCAIMGVTTMEEFALPIVFGLIAGTYSSVLLAPSLWVYFRKLGAKIKKSAKVK